ncbi:DUF2325 domain-containing protein [Rubrivivax rivuli]|uniref:DUF2325 domain-containing protein n=1 Tax=Rubrivivax rivuli TaxID=1862385 RepID=A0A437RLK1_9BURK|nr:DUF2325 domain-containing protein [Rubrivivax rivuli]RVU47455.1 DUF2325 domain-containing protein [Rubrivivax rivuli]
MKIRIEPRHLTRAVARVQRCRATATVTATEAKPSAGRRRLWDLPPRALDMVLGIGLPHEALRRVARRVLRAEPQAQGHELHAGLVAECRRRGPMAEALQEALERQHAATQGQAHEAGCTEALAAWWQDRAARGELPGALWAVLTHPHCTEALQQRVLGEVQMLQFQAGQAARVELARFEALIDENAVLGRALAAAQQRCAQGAAEHARERAAWLSEGAALRGRLAAMEARLAERPGPASADAQRLDRQAARISALERALAVALAGAGAAPQTAATSPRAAATALPEPLPVLPQPASAAPALDQRNVLCVGGRTAIVPVYRRLIEASGGRFLHHDGGEEDKLGALDATLAAADLVICQAGCVSHNAYWRVKDHCKRTGKRCVFVETPSAAGLQRALAQISG